MKILLFIVCLSGSWPVWADSPLTSVEFWKEAAGALGDPIAEKMIVEAQEDILLTPAMMEFLSNPQVSHGAKIALINASFHQGVVYTPGYFENAKRYRQFLEKKYSTSLEIYAPRPSNNTLIWDVIYGRPMASVPPMLNAGELLSLGYLMALDHYDFPAEALGLLLSAAQMDPRSLAIRVALALTVGNIVMRDNDMIRELENLSAEALSQQPPAFHKRLLKSQVHLSQGTRYAYLFSLSQPFVQNLDDFRLDFPVPALGPLLGYFGLYREDHEEWVSQQQRFESTLKKFTYDCEGLLRPKNRSQPL